MLGELSLYGSKLAPGCMHRGAVKQVDLALPLFTPSVCVCLDSDRIHLHCGSAAPT